jgi:hypothetical protein
VGDGQTFTLHGRLQGGVRRKGAGAGNPPPRKPLPTDVSAEQVLGWITSLLRRITELMRSFRLNRRRVRALNVANANPMERDLVTAALAAILERHQKMRAELTTTAHRLRELGRLPHKVEHYAMILHVEHGVTTGLGHYIQATGYEPMAAYLAGAGARDLTQDEYPERGWVSAGSVVHPSTPVLVEDDLDLGAPVPSAVASDQEELLNELGRPALPPYLERRVTAYREEQGAVHKRLRVIYNLLQTIPAEGEDATLADRRATLRRDLNWYTDAYENLAAKITAAYVGLGAPSVDDRRRWYESRGVQQDEAADSLFLDLPDMVCEATGEVLESAVEEALAREAAAEDVVREAERKQAIILASFGRLCDRGEVLLPSGEGLND